MKKLLLAISLLGFTQNLYSETPFIPEMKGIGFWENTETVKKSQMGELAPCFSKAVACYDDYGIDENTDEYQLDIIVGMGRGHEILGIIAGQKFKTLLREEDITSSEWHLVSKDRAEGSFEFDAPYAEGTAIFRAIKVKGEWAVNYLAIPASQSANKPLILVDYSEKEITKFFAQSTSADEALSKAIQFVETIGFTEMDDQTAAMLEVKTKPIKEQMQMTDKQYEYFLAEYKRMMEALWTSRELKVEIARIYQSYFTDDEIEQLIAFYQNPVMQKMLEREEQIEVKQEQAVRELVQNNLTQKFETLFEETMKQ